MRIEQRLSDVVAFLAGGAKARLIGAEQFGYGLGRLLMSSDLMVDQ